MEDKQLTTQESLDLISKMIADTRRNFNRRGGAMFLIWGYSTIAVTAAAFVLLLTTGSYSSMYVWWALPVIGGALTWLHYRKHALTVKTHLDKAINYVWTVAGAAAVICSAFAFAASSIAGRPLINILFTIALIIGMATATTGLMIKFRPVAAGGFAAMALAFAIPWFPNFWQFPIFAAIFLIGQVIPGHLLDRYCANEPHERR